MLPATIPYPAIDPFVFRSSSFSLSWYATMYLAGFIAAYFVSRFRFRHGTLRLRSMAEVNLLISDCCLGVIVGGRVGYILFYNLDYYLADPLQMIAIWNGGMSFHGGLVGVLLACFFFARRQRVPVLHLLDHLSICAPIGLGLGRIGNFINGELYGRITDLPWGMVFPLGGPLARHPSQLYEALLEGLVLFGLMWWLTRKRLPDGVVSAGFLIAYSLMRFAVEFVREPDAHLGFVLGPLSMGQLLSMLMALAGIALAWRSLRRAHAAGR